MNTMKQGLVGALSAALLLASGAALAQRATLDNLGTLGGGYSIGYALNNSGQVAGLSKTSSGYNHAFLWSPGGGMQDLGTLGGGYSIGYALNNSGQVAGESNERAFRWSAGSGMQDLGTLPGAYYSYGRALNERGQVAGGAQTLFSHHAFLWSPGGGMQDLGTLPGADYSFGYALNNSAQVAGVLDTPTGSYHAFLWSPGSGMQDLGTLPGGYNSYGYGLNNSGQVVGRADTPYLEDHGFLWNAGTMYDLNSLAPGCWEPHAINDSAQIAGVGYFSGQSRAFRLTLHPDWLGGNGNWSSAANWNFAGMGSFGITPGLPHDVAITPVASATVYGPTSATVNSLTISATGSQLATLDLNWGSIVAVNGVTLGNNATVTGSGRLAGDLAIGVSGRVLVGNSQSLQLAGNVTNGGRIDALSTSGRANLEIGGTLTNAASSESGTDFYGSFVYIPLFEPISVVNLMNADLFAHGGIVNAGRMSLTGFSTVAGRVTNQAVGQVNVSGVASEAIFWDDFVNNGSVNVTTGSTATFFGLVSGMGSFLGAGTKHFAGGVAPGGSPGLLTMDGSIVFSGSTLSMELGGLTPGSGHDKIVFLPGSTVTLSSVGLDVTYWGGWTASLGDTYDLFDWNGLSGTFSSVALPTLASGLVWDTSALYTSGEISVAAVPEPSASLMLLAGLGLVGWAARRCGAV